ncbi:hypothetical protein CRUP_002312 [Coryphaenoides rupestris]|nr:hypothetical protein CRUP_002312 [Coryphaenoides rupestris]
MLATGGGTAGSGLSEVDQRIMGTTAVAGVPGAEDMDTDQGYHLLSSAAAAPTPDPSPLLISADSETDAGDMAAANQDSSAGQGVDQSDENEEVMRALLIHEKRGGAGGGGGGGAGSGGGARGGGGGVLAAANASDSDSDTSESDDDVPAAPALAAAVASARAGGGATVKRQHPEDDDDEFDEVGEEPTVLVGGKSYSYREVSQRPQLVEQMSAQEKEAYIEMGQHLFQDMYF